MNEHPPSIPDTILFVDDEAKARKYFSMLFGRERKVLTAADGLEGWELYQQHRAEIGIVVTDQIMPRMTGLELLSHLRSEPIPVIRILSTAYAESELVTAAVNDGLIDYFIGKPWNLEKFESLIQQSLSLLGHRLPAAEWRIA